MVYLLNMVIEFAWLTDTSTANNFIISLFLAFLVVVFSLRYRFLTFGGAAVTCLMAIIIFSLGSWKWTMPMFTFFFLSSLLSKMREKKNNMVDSIFEKTGRRDFFQVIANGGFASLIVIVNYIWPSELFYAAYVSSIASVCADTWATEIGTMSQYKTYNILTLRITEPGTSGGVSLPGFLGAAAGALVIAFSGINWVESNSFVYILLILFTGFIASVIDSILGGTVQIQYKCRVCEQITEKKEHCNTFSVTKRGFRWFNNDVVNLISGTAGAAIGYIITDLILY